MIWLNPLRTDYAMFDTPLSPKECLERLREQAMSHYYRAWLYDCSRPLAGWVTDDDFDVSRCVFYKNAYRTWAKGKLLGTGQGTVVSCRTGISHLTLAGAMLILVAWIAVLTFIPSLAILQVAFVLWLASVALRLYLARDDRVFLLTFLKSTIEARERSAPVVVPDRQGVVEARQLYRTLPGHHVPVWVWLLLSGTVVVILWKIALVGIAIWRYG